MGKKHKGQRPVKQGDLDDAMRQVLLGKAAQEQRSENTRPSKAQLAVRYRLDRRK